MQARKRTKLGLSGRLVKNGTPNVRLSLGFESLSRHEVCSTSSQVLLPSGYRAWPTLPTSSNSSFNSRASDIHRSSLQCLRHANMSRPMKRRRQDKLCRRDRSGIRNVCSPSGLPPSYLSCAPLRVMEGWTAPLHHRIGSAPQGPADPAAAWLL